MPKSPRFSVVTPSYNQAATITQTIESVLSQNYPNLEYFVYDAQSDDGTGQIIKKYTKFLKYQIKQDAGQADALNKAFKTSTGDILAFINSDDYYLPGAFAAVSRYFIKHPDCQWLVGDCLTEPNSFLWTFRLKELMPYDRFPSLLYLFNFINQPAVFIRRDLFVKAGSFNINLHYCFDYDYWLRLLKLAPPHRLKTPLAVFRISKVSKGTLGYRKQFQEDYLVIGKYTRNIFNKLLHKIISLVIITIYKIIK